MPYDSGKYANYNSYICGQSPAGIRKALMNINARRRIFISLIPILVLMGLLALNVSIFGTDALSGASQVALLFSTAVCCILSRAFFGTRWSEFEKAIGSSIGGIAHIILLLLLIGALGGTWTMSGVVPTMIYYGVKAISPKVFLVSATLICALVSLMTGSSWTTIATIGIALLGIGRVQGFSDAVTAGAIISGAYFGDKMSPMSDTTVMASSMSGVPIFKHIRFLMTTTVPTLAVTLTIFLILGLAHTPSGEGDLEGIRSAIVSRFNISPWLLLIPLATVVMIYRKIPAIVVLAFSAAIAGVTCLFAQPSVMQEIALPLTGDNSGTKGLFVGLVRTIYDSVGVTTGNPDVDSLVSSKGMSGMLNTVYLIICAMFFGGCMQASGMIRHIASGIIPLTRRRVPLVATTAATGVALNAVVSDQYLSIILTSNIFKGIYEKEGHEGKLLGRTIEDSSTVTSVLVPWNTCGMTQATILGIPTLTYLPFCFFNLLCPVMTVLMTAIGTGLGKRKNEDKKTDLANGNI